MAEKSFLIRLSADERDALRRQAAAERRSMQDVARMAVLDRIAAGHRESEIRSSLERIMARDTELLDRLGK